MGCFPKMEGLSFPQIPNLKAEGTGHCMGCEGLDFVFPTIPSRRITLGCPPVTQTVRPYQNRAVVVGKTGSFRNFARAIHV